MCVDGGGPHFDQNTPLLSKFIKTPYKTSTWKYALVKTKGNSQNFNIQTQQNPSKYNIIATPGSKNPIPKEPKTTNLAPLLNILIQHYKTSIFPPQKIGILNLW